MSNCWLIWREDETRNDARKSFADDEESAVCRWARYIDGYGADFLIAQGQSARVFCALNEEGSEAALFEVSGEAVPQYSAERIE